MYTCTPTYSCDEYYTSNNFLNVLTSTCPFKGQWQQIKQETINTIAKKARGDVRAALNDLQTILTLGEDAYVSSQVEREKQESIFDALKKVFQQPPDERTIRVYDNTKMELNEISLWVEENLIF